MVDSATTSRSGSTRPTTPTVRYIPGATSSIATSTDKPRPKNRKRKSQKVLVSGEPTTTDETPVALLRQAPEASELPAELVAEKGELEVEVAATEGKDQAQVQEGSRKKGAAEEMVYRRLKVLSKKIQRFQAYKTKDESALNPDQKAAIASLPVLEAGLRELEEVQKALEAVEVEQAKERKALAEENQRLLHQAKAHAVEDYKKTTLPLLSSLISIHATLHPQPTGASFIPPDLPAHLQDISNEDVKSIDDMFEKLRSRNLEAFDSALEEIRSLQILVGGPGALAVSPPTANVDKSEDALNFSPTLPTSERFDEPAPTTFELPQTQAEMAHQEPIETEQIQAVFREASVEAPVIPSFIQTSEIVLAGNEQGSGVQAPEAQAIKGPSIAQQVASTADEAAQAGDEVPTSVAETPKFDWAADDDEDDHKDLDALRASFGITSLQSGTPGASAAPASTIPVAPGSTAGAGEASLQPAQQTEPQGGRGGGRGGNRGPRARGGPGGAGRDNRRSEGGADGKGQQGRSAHGGERAPRHRNNTSKTVPSNNKPTADDEGFQVVSRRTTSASLNQDSSIRAGRGGRGRGGPRPRGGPLGQGNVAARKPEPAAQS